MLLLQGEYGSNTQAIEIIYTNSRADVRMTDELALNIGYRYVGARERLSFFTA